MAASSTATTPARREVRDATKFERLVAFGEGLSERRPAVAGDLAVPGLPERKVIALVVRLLDETLIRVGNESYAAESETFGLTTMRADHVEVDGGAVVFDFVSKGGVDREVQLRDPHLARIVHQCHELGGQDLFSYRSSGQVVDVTSTSVNDYLRERTGTEVTAKDFRPWGAPPPPPPSCSAPGRRRTGTWKRRCWPPTTSPRRC